MKQEFGMRLRRLTLVALLAAALAPGLWWRSIEGWQEPNHAIGLSARRLAAPTPTIWPAGLRLVGAWHLTSLNNRFGGYSALLATDGDTLTAISDIGETLRFRRPGRGMTDPQFGRVTTRDVDWLYLDVEAATSDPKSGTRWLAYEKTNRIRRFAVGDDAGMAVAPPAMRDWPENGGAESMVRLADGRFIVLEENPSWLSIRGQTGLLFPSDPVTGVRPLQFRFRPPLGYQPSDMTGLPDGRVLILLRALDLPIPPFFTAMLVVADPAAIAEGQEWRWRKLADLTGSVPRENYEGVASVADAQGATLWLISDDNFMYFQRTLLLELHWQLPPRAGAR